MSVKVGDKIPSVKIKHKTADGVKDVNPAELFAGKKVVVFALPGAFTPTCSARHLPGFVDKNDDLKKKGVDLVACLSVNDAFVMEAWGNAQNVGDKVLMLADGNGEFTRAMGLEMDGTGHGMGARSKRYAMIVDNGVITSLETEQPGKFEVSSAEAILAKL
jgi:peroxiredoxin